MKLDILLLDLYYSIAELLGIMTVGVSAMHCFSSVISIHCQSLHSFPFLGLLLKTTLLIKRKPAQRNFY